ncbi:unnamed protein product [Phyllotreta striolata]|uniref:MBD domain-containing protein n=1 Tax=Phyllotreta striolata TaxID=444603 RepID=A0A9N9TTE3_PHYSR|nr:unnamed protein product [Phyllotreta striolata]
MDTRKRGRGKPKSPAHAAGESAAPAEPQIEIAPKLTPEKNRSESADKEAEITKENVGNGKADEIEPTEKPKDESSTESKPEPVTEPHLEQKTESKQLEDHNSIMESVERQVESIMMGTDPIKDHVTDDSITKEDDSKEKALKGKKRKIDLDTSKLDDDQMNVDMYPIGTKEILGKGKRARIPNKRYSDVLLSPTHSKKTSLTAVENGNVIEKVDKPQEKVEKPQEKVEKALEKAPEKLERTESTNSGNETDTSMGHSDPKYLKPFEFGWKRELVWRLTYDESKGRQGDVYYFTPTGKKVRSRREVVEHLTGKDLTIDNFSFSKEEIGIGDPELEIIRNAKVGNTDKSLIKQAVNRSLKNTPVSSPKSPKMPSCASSKNFGSKVSSPKLASPKVETTEAAISPSKIKPAKNIRMKTPAKKDVKETKKVETPEEQMEVDEPPAKTLSSKKGRKLSCDDTETGGNVSSPDKPCQPCSIRCKGVRGVVPTLQCRICLCLYHHECVGVSSALLLLPYVCKNCHLEGQEQTPVQATLPLPPLTPINVLKSAGNQSNALPKLQRIPKPSTDDPEAPVDPLPLPEPPKLTPRPPQTDETKSLVGSLTTWLPHNSKIIDSIQATGEAQAGVPRPQYIEILAGRKFLVIPKHNFLTISPPAAATAVGDADDALLNADSADSADSRIKIEPDSPSKPENSQTPEAMPSDAEGFSDEKDAAASALMDVTECGSSSMSESFGAKKPSISSPSSAVVNNTSSVSTPAGHPKTTTTLKKRTIKLRSITTSSDEKDKDENKFMFNYLQNLSYGYNTLLYVFQYLKVQDLLRASCVCTMWRDIAGHPMLWKTVRMKNSQVHSFDGLANSLRKHGTVHLDLRKMLLPNGGDEIWPEFSKAIAKVETLRRIELCRCPASVVENLAASNPRLEVINAVTIKCESMNLEPLKSLKDINELRLKSTGGLTLTSNIDSLKFMKGLKHLSLTSIKDLDKMNLDVIAELANLESLDLGECTDFPKDFGDTILIKLTKLERLRLEKGQGNCHTFEILEAVKQMDKLDQLELVNFDIKSGFDKALGVCHNIKKLLIIPTYISQSATTNHMVLGGVRRLQKTLSHFVWGVTLELLRVTELFVDQCEEPKDKKDKVQVGNGDCIPVLKPVPLVLDKNSEVSPAFEPPQVEILALPSLQKLLMQNLPTTRVKILKIPFHATWRQSITDSVN